MGRLKIWFRPLRNNRGEGSISTGVKVIIAVVIGALTRVKAAVCPAAGEGYVDTGVKIIISVVIGGLLLAGLYTLFNSTIVPTLGT